MSTISNREFPIPDHVDIFHVTREIAPSTKSALECVMEVDEERIRLEAVRGVEACAWEREGES